MKKLCFLALLSLVVAAGCSKDDTNSENSGQEPTLTIETLDYTIPAGGSVEVSFEVDVDWTASVEYADGDTKWLTLTPESGKAGKVTLTITAEPTVLRALRKASVRILNSEDTLCVLSVVQSIADESAEDITAFFDPLFAQELQKRGYVVDAEHITHADVKDITELDVSCKGYDYDLQKYVYGELTSLQGIEYFESLTELNCKYNRLTSLDVSKNPVLTELDCDGNQLTSLDMSKNPALIALWCSQNELTSLDLSENPALEKLACVNNPLTLLNINNNLALKYLWCSYTQLTSLNLSNNPVLEYMICTHNPLTSLDLSKNTRLTVLDCNANQLTSLNISNCTALIALDCTSNQLISLDVSNNSALKQLHCWNNPLTSLDIRNNSALEGLTCYTCRLTSLDVSYNLSMKALECHNNPGDGAVFPVTAWFDNNTVPSDRFTTGNWYYDGKPVQIDYRKAE